jgi:hypothetical protein
MRLSIFAKIEISLLLATILATSAPLVNAQNPDFNIAANPSSRCINIGSATTYQITVSSVDGFSGQVTLGADIQPTVNNGPTISPTQTSVSISSSQPATFNLNVATTSSTPNQVYTITVDGFAGSNNHFVYAYLAFAPNCGTVGGTISPASALSLATPFIGFAAVISAIAGAASIAFIRTRQKRTAKN